MKMLNDLRTENAPIRKLTYSMTTMLVTMQILPRKLMTLPVFSKLMTTVRDLNAMRGLKIIMTPPKDYHKSRPTFQCLKSTRHLKKKKSLLVRNPFETEESFTYRKVMAKMTGQHMLARLTHGTCKHVPRSPHVSVNQTACPHR